MNLVFANPLLLWLLLLLPLLALLKGRSGKAAAILFSSTAIAKAVSGKSRQRAGRFLFLLKLLALGCMIIAMARPQWAEGHTESESSGIDIVIAFDLSSSMLALDFSEGGRIVTRLDAAKLVTEEFIKRRSSDRLGLIAFAGNPYLISPLTMNHSWLLRNLERLNIGLVEDGTAIGSALAMSVNRLRDVPSENTRVIILLTDGVNNAGTISPRVAAETAAAFGIKVYAVGIGGDERVAVPHVDRQGNILRDAFGRVMTAGYADPIDAESLREIARITDGAFFRGVTTDELDDIYRKIDRLQRTDVTLNHYSTYHELYFWPLMAGLFLLLTGQILSNTLWRRLP
jgi:Ca-activated chloride channel family protein